eukprot:CAMPEP_0117655110 /NCGR_PEP_ID=MMETSP0804-20121206/4106_1 /TAXON_ID=1074897 /ORGANISM="Tetraselmis astigmatica, Strain CCMP880" /LENGTH=205 /DNA_ID=CAMNT_0005461443 /DNA_START=810 /DNA_END=1423 /DNA_ORIENTATION=+
MHRRALVYAGAGAGQFSVQNLLDSLRRTLEPYLKVQLISAADLLEGSWTDGCVMLAVPGGADLPYCRELNGRGNQVIRDFVEGGGSYLGLCAGAYYASSRVEFEIGTQMEVAGPRELSFFPGVARGSVYSGFNYRTQAGATVAPLIMRDPSQSHSLGHSSAATSPPWQACSDYFNGGPLFAAPGAVPELPDSWDAIEERFPGTVV